MLAFVDQTAWLRRQDFTLSCLGVLHSNGLGFNIYEGGTDAADPAYTRYGCDRLLLECLTCGNPRTG